jgi:hypothetical protein
VWIAIGEGVETGAEDDELGGSAADGEGEFVFGEAGADGHKGAHVAGGGRKAVGDCGDGRGGFAADDADGERVFEDFRGVEELMGGAADGDALGGAAGAAFDHECLDEFRFGKLRVPPPVFLLRVGMLFVLM